MATLPMTQRLYDKIASDVQEFRNMLWQYTSKNFSSYDSYLDLDLDYYWQLANSSASKYVAAYFEWVETESSKIRPSSLRHESVSQCIGGIASFDARARDAAKAIISRYANSDQDQPADRWSDERIKDIWRRGEILEETLGFGRKSLLSLKVSNFIEDHKWLPLLFSLVSLIVSLALAIDKVFE